MRTRYFETIHKTKRNMWLFFLKEAENKKIFDAYKYIKHKDYDKIPILLFNVCILQTFCVILLNKWFVFYYIQRLLCLEDL